MLTKRVLRFLFFFGVDKMSGFSSVFLGRSRCPSVGRFQRFERAWLSPCTLLSVLSLFVLHAVTGKVITRVKYVLLFKSVHRWSTVCRSRCLFGQCIRVENRLVMNLRLRSHFVAMMSVWSWRLKAQVVIDWCTLFLPLFLVLLVALICTNAVGASRRFLSL